MTLLTAKVGGALASQVAPLVAKGPWLQILVDADWLALLEADLAPLQQPDTVTSPPFTPLYHLLPTITLTIPDFYLILYFFFNPLKPSLRIPTVHLQHPVFF